ncbi:hypothetical protein CPB84DRAFT_1795183 [Gymnopilus junonius]|uniref:Uncharacterized protein n=1 Tax=Gymnopilus junonius TaxID=109634 RepID=A0A9P5NBL1_GYMJU|nr:hypothetical protein CPB84DRAFT_1795183 [Gymnopilus junonius]
MSSNSGNPSKTTGQWHAAKGEIKHGLSRTFASSNLQQEGEADRQTGRSKIDAARGQKTDSGARYEGAGSDRASGWNEHQGRQPERGQWYDQQIDTGSTASTTIPGYAAGTGPDTPLGGDNSSYPGGDTTTGTRDPRFNAFAPGGVPMGPGPQGLQGDQPRQGNSATQSREVQQNMDEWNRNAF